MNILLIGARGCGKTEVGRRLAEALGLSFADLDELARARFPESSIAEIWAARGEKAWRGAETAALRAVLAGSEQVVALGGGTPMIEQARRLIARERRAGRAKVVYLQCPASVLERRLRNDAGDRPSLTGGGVAEEIGAVLGAREPTYLEMADIVQNASAGPRDVMRELMTELGDG